MMPDSELIALAAERGMGWSVVRLKNWRSVYITNGPFPELVVCRNGVTVLWRKAGQEHSDETWNPLESDADAMMLVDKLAPLAGDYRSGDGFFILKYGEYADHDETADEDGGGSCTCGGRDLADDGSYEASWSAHFHIGLLGEGPDYPAGWDHGKKFCARAKDRRRAIVLASLKAVGAIK